MPNIAAVLRNEIARIARKEIRRQTRSVKQAAGSHRREIAALKRRVHELERELRRLARSKPSSANSPKDEPTVGRRFSPKGLAGLRQRLGLTATELGQLVGASALSIYKWEHGKARPRAKFLEAIAAVRGIGKREAQARLAR